MFRALVALCLLAGLALPLADAAAFCGLYVAKTDTPLSNKASKIILARDDDKTVLTMASDYQGDPTEFAMVVPVPTSIERGQIHVTESAIVEQLDAYSAPRLVEYYDENPCDRRAYESMMMKSPEMAGAVASGSGGARALGVKTEAKYTVDEYDITILSAEQSEGLAAFLTESGYTVPESAERALQSYISQGMRFFLAKVNLEEQARLGHTYLRPLQVAFESPKFMLPIRLGMANAKGAQELLIFTLTRKGRVETTNYRTVRIPTGIDIPLYVKDNSASFYEAMFNQQVKKENRRTMFLEYAWDMGWCNPCAAAPLSNSQLRELGVFWLSKTNDGVSPVPMQGMIAPMPVQNVFLTRLHVRYDAEHFPEDLMFRETEDRDNFQGRYILRHPWKGEMSCEEGGQYAASLPKRYEQEALNLSQITGWEVADIRRKMNSKGQSFDGKDGSNEDQWWENLWKE